MFRKIAERLRPSNPLPLHKIRIEYGEILAQADCDGILFFIQPNLAWQGGLNRKILQLAGSGLDDYVLDHVTSPKSGEVFPLPPFNAAYKQLFMAILPDWDGGNGFEERDLLNCYRSAVSEAQATGVKRLAMPALGLDKRDFPHIRFARLAMQGILETLDDRLDYIKVVCADRTMVQTYQDQIAKKKQKGNA